MTDLCVVTCAGGDDDELFYLHPSTGDLWLMGCVDAEMRDRYDLVVRLSDGSSSVEAKVGCCKL